MQVVGYRTGESDEAGLLVSDAAPASDPAAVEAGPHAVEFVSLAPGTDLSYTLGERRCAGTVSDAGHRACDAAAAPYCDHHTDTWVCARCTGECLKDEMDCHEEHAVYLAAFAPDTFKVGVTRLWRLETRLREQGADRAAHVRTVADGRRARQIEAEIATDLTDRVRIPTKRRGLAAGVDEGAWADLLASFGPVETFDFDYGLDLADRPVAETIATGIVRGTKGRLLVLEHAGSTYAVDVRELVGYELSEGATGRDVQSSLGAFG